MGKDLLPLMITTVGKVIGTIIGGVILGFHWPETVAFGLLLSAKEHFSYFHSHFSKQGNLFSVLIIYIYT